MTEQIIPTDNNFDYDVVIIGSGPGGYTAAIRASQLGSKVAIIEKDLLGGVCLNWGCIPTKAMLFATTSIMNAKNLPSFGINYDNLNVDFTQVLGNAHQTATKLRSGLSYLMHKNNITVINGIAQLASEHEITVDGKKITTKYIILATGATARALPNLPFDGKNILSYKEAISLNEKPQTIAVLGGGAIGIELACFYNSVGSQVYVFESHHHILPVVDEEIGFYAEKKLIKQGLNIISDVRTDAIVVKDNKVHISYKDNTLVVDKLIVAIGVVPNLTNLGIEKIGVEKDGNFIKINEFCQTNIRNIYAIGDIAGNPCLAHKASKEGRIAAEHLHEISAKPINKANVPYCIYSHPYIAGFGITEKEAKNKGIETIVGRYPLSANPKVVAFKEHEGVMKIIINKANDAILGAFIVGTNADELISYLSLAANSGMSAVDLIENIFPHPTISESITEALLDAYERCINY